MRRIFISYARRDQAFARRLANKLESIGADVWIDLDDIVAGEKWSSAIQNGLDTSDGMVVILSPDSMASNNVEDEWQYFMDHGNPVIPILLTPAKVHFQLNRLQYVDFHTQEFDPAFADLLNELRIKGVALDGGVNPVKSIVEPKQASVIATVEKAQASTQTKPLWQQTPLIVGAVAILIAIIGFGIWYTLPDNNEAFDFVEEAVIIEDDEWQVHENGNRSSQLITVGEGEILHRGVSNDEVWFSLLDYDMDFIGYQLAENIPVDNYSLLSVVPMEITILGDSITLYERPYTSGNTIEAELEGTSYLYGKYQDPDGNIWHYVTVFEDDGGVAYTGWTGSDQLLINDEFDILPLIYSTQDIEVDEGTIRQDDLLWLISVDINSTLYEVAYYDRDNAEWRIAFVEDDDLEIDSNNNRLIPYRGN